MKKVFVMAGIFMAAALMVFPAMAIPIDGGGPILVPGYLGDPSLVGTASQDIAASQISISGAAYCDTEFSDELPCWIVDTSVLDASDTFFISEGIDGFTPAP